jgi:hypothetical protein
MQTDLDGAESIWEQTCICLPYSATIEGLMIVYTDDNSNYDGHWDISMRVITGTNGTDTSLFHATDGTIDDIYFRDPNAIGQDPPGITTSVNGS